MTQEGYKSLQLHRYDGCQEGKIRPNHVVTHTSSHRTPFLLERMTARKTRLLELESLADIFKMNKHAFSLQEQQLIVFVANNTI